MNFLSKIADYTIEPLGRLLGRQVGYVIHYKTNLQNLQAKVEELKAARQAVENEIVEAERKGEEIKPDVRLWLKKAGEITAQTDEFMKDERQAKLKCFHGFCPNLTVRHQLSRKSTKLTQEVVEQHEKRGSISKVSGGVLRKEVWSVTTGDYQAFESRMSTVKEIMDSLKDTDIQRMGVYGMGGVGKTTLVKEVYKQASEDKMLFDDVVILLDVKKEADLEAIQKKIVEQLRMDINVKDETIVGRASRLCARIQGKKILVILDDVQEKIDLEAIGLPRMPTCKVLVTCRTRDVLFFNEMRADKEFPLDLLGKEESWSLFVKMVGDVVKNKGRIQDVAIQVAQKCGGLPLLVVTVASALKGKKKLREWKDALRKLKGFDKEELTEKAYLALEWSYDQLDDKVLKPLFLLSGIIVEQNHISVQQLLRYGVGLGLFTNVNTLEEAQNALDTLLGKLKNSCLLLDSDTEGVVRMHDLVCHVAKLIAYRDHHMLSIEYGGEFKEWPDIDFLKKCSWISLIHEIIPKLPQVPMECPELELFYLNSTKYDESLQIPSDFFSEMQKLRVLSLTNMSVPSLPSSLQYLKELQTLCLDDCELGDITLLGKLSSLEVLSFSESNVRVLPKEIGQLTLLRLLDLSDCSSLEVISPTVISSLVKLEDLNMRNSFKKWEVEGKGSNASLSELKHLSELSSLEVHIPNVDALPANLFSNKLERFNIYIGDVWDEWGNSRSPWEHLNKTMTLNTLKLKLTKEIDESIIWLIKNSEYLSIDETDAIVNSLNAEDLENVIHLQLQNNVDFMAMVNKKVVFPNLKTLWVQGCDKLKFLFSFSMAKSLVQLTHMKVSECKLLQEIVSSTKEDSEENTDGLFSKLKILQLEKLPDLARFSTGDYREFPSLEELEINDCDNMGAFISGKVSVSTKDSRSCKEIEHRILEEEENFDVESETSAKYFLFNDKVVFPNLKTLWVQGCDKLKFLFSFSMAKSLVQLTHMKVSECKLLQEIVSSTKEDSEENTDGLFSKLKILKLEKLPDLARFSTGDYREFPSLEELEINDCDNMGAFISGKVSVSTKDSRSCKEIEHRILEEEENFDVESETSAKYFLFNDKVVFPNLETLWVHRCNKLKFIFSFSMAKSLVQLIHLKVSKCKLLQEIVSSTKEDSEENTDGLFSKLKILKLEELPDLARFSTGDYREFPSLEELEINDCDNMGAFISGKVSVSTKDSRSCKEIEHRILEEEENFDVESETSAKYFLFNDKVVFPNLETLWVHRCNKLKFIFSFSMAKSLVQLIHLKVSKCKLLQEIVSSTKEDSEENTDGLFSKLKILKLEELPDLARFSTGDYREFPSLEELEINDCDNMGAFISGKVSVSTKDSRSCKEIEQRILKEEENFDVESETAAKYFLFNDKVGFPVLERLTIIGIRELKAIWHIQLSQNSFRRLKKVDVGQCNNIVCLFPPSVMGRLNALETLEIWRCDSIEVVFEEIVGAEEEQEVVVTSPPIAFPKVTSLFLSRLPQLKGCINASQWPSLKQIEVYPCDKVGIFGAEVSHVGKKYEMETLMTSQRPLFLTDKDSFHNLEDIRLNGMEIWNGPLPAYELVFGKLKLISVYGNYGLFSKQVSVLFLLRLQNLEEIHFRNNSYETISGQEIHDDAVEIVTFSRVRRLKLEDMEKLMHLGNDNSESLYFPNLETLELWWCSRLKSMESSAISFRNLTILKVWYCNGFEYLIRCSVAKSLVQLKTLEVVRCESVVAIVASNMGDDDAVEIEIVFGHLQRLYLNRLIRLKGFCSGNCRVKVPSSITLQVVYCSIKLKITSDGFLLTEVEDQCVQKGDDEQQNDTETLAQTTPEILPEENAV